MGLIRNPLSSLSKILQDLKRFFKIPEELDGVYQKNSFVFVENPTKCNWVCQRFHKSRSCLSKVVTKVAGVCRKFL